MAIVRITEDLVRSIVANVKQLYAADAASIPVIPKRLTTSLADALYEYVLPPVIEEELLRVTPKWMQRLSSTFELHIGRHRFDSYTMTERVYWGHREYKIYNVPGVPILEVRGQEFKLTEGSGCKFDLDAMHPELRAVFEVIDANAAAAQKYVAELGAAEERIKTFLRQHTTLQSALKAFGPALWDLVPDKYKQQYAKPVIRATGTAKAHQSPPPEVDVTDVIGRIAAKRLGMDD